MAANDKRVIGNVSAPSTDRDPAAPFGLHKHLVLTYDSARHADGVGAQLHRIYGTYSIARLLGASYFHSPIGRVDYQGFAALEGRSSDPRFHQEFNELFQIESDVLPTDDFHAICLPWMSVATFKQLATMFDIRRRDGRPSLIRLAFPFGVADRFPECYEVCKAISPFAASASVGKGRPLRVAIHVRRGELFALDSDRMLPNGYYIEVAQQVARVLETLEIDYQIELHTEAPDGEFVIRPGDLGIAHRISAPVVVSREMCRLDEFRVLPRLVYRVNDKAIECIRQLATADVLVTSRSSFSYLGGILNRAGIVLFHPFWHGAPSSWITVAPDGHFDEAQFRQAVTARLGLADSPAVR